MKMYIMGNFPQSMGGVSLFRGVDTDPFPDFGMSTFEDGFCCFSFLFFFYILESNYI